MAMKKKGTPEKIEVVENDYLEKWRKLIEKSITSEEPKKEKKKSK